MRIHLELLPEGEEGGRLSIRVEDSGKGFDARAVLARAADTSRLSGRGLTLVRQLAARCDLPEDGKGIRAEFVWPRPS